jgi:hypothetical protein
MGRITTSGRDKDLWDDPDYREAVKEVGYSEDDLFKLHPSFYPVDSLRWALWSTKKMIEAKRLAPRGQTPIPEGPSTEPLESEWNPSAASPPHPPPTTMEWDGNSKWSFDWTLPMLI